MKEIKLSKIQLSDMKHAIGGKADLNPYRNYFNTRIDSKSWDELVDLELATKRNAGEEMGGIYYHITAKGINYIYSVIKEMTVKEPEADRNCDKDWFAETC